MQMNIKTTLVNGDFNILHPGHLRLLKFAKECGGRLVVAVNSDKLANNKGILDEKVRLESLQATSYVDEAFILNESLIEYIKKTKPNFIVKGKEHQNRVNPEEKVLKEYGGKLIFTSGEIGFSSLDALDDKFDINISFIKHDINFLKRHDIKKENLLNLVEKFSKLKVLVIGDTIIDEYISCEAIGMSGEDPTIVVSPISNKKFIGAAAIVASHAKTLGADVNYISVLGDDENYTFTEKYLSNLKIKVKLYKDITRHTTLKQRYQAKGKTLLRVNFLKQHSISKDFEKSIIKKVKNMTNLSLIIFSDFSYGVLSKKIIKSISKFAYKNNISVVADSQSSSQVGDISKFKNMHLVTPTEKEIRLSLNDFKSGLVVLSEKLHKKSNPKFIFTTLAQEGLMIYNSNKNELLTDNIKALNANAKNSSGAGDSLLVASSLALSVGANIWQSAYLGQIASALQVSRLGNIPIQKDELIKEINF